MSRDRYLILITGVSSSFNPISCSLHLYFMKYITVIYAILIPSRAALVTAKAWSVLIREHPCLILIAHVSEARKATSTSIVNSALR